MRKILFSLIAILISSSSYSQDNERNNIIKVKFSAFTTEFGYERGFKREPSLYSFDIGFGFIVPEWFSLEGNPQLYNLRLGVKQYMNKDATPFKGWFIKNEIFSQYAYKLYDNSDRKLMDYYTFAYNFSVGYQFLFFKRISLEMNIGLGVAYSNFSERGDGWFDIDFGIATLDGMRFGIMKRGDMPFSPCIVGAFKIGFLF